MTQPTIHQAAQHGDLAMIRILQQHGRKWDDRDENNTTPLHWAAVGNHLECVRFFLQQGADANVRGGELMATPVHWASRSGLIQMVDLLIRHGGDPTLKDGQGYDALLLASHGAHSLLMLYLIKGQDMNVDDVDDSGRTPLMWSVYMGLSFEAVDLLISLGADVNRQDKMGLTALHWAVATNHYDYCKVLLKAGIDSKIRDSYGKTPEDVAQGGNLQAYQDSFKDLQKTPDDPAIFDWYTTDRILSVLPFVMMPIISWTMGFFPWFLSIPLMMLEFYSMFHALTTLLGTRAPSKMIKSLFPTAFFQASCYWVYITYWFHLVKHVSHMTLLNIFFNVTWVACMWNLYKTMFQDPGYLPIDGDLKEKVLELAEVGRLNLDNFCMSCSSPRVPRSKHCKVCKRCVARFDHHCPYTACCVGATNHRRFLIFTALFSVSALSFVYMVWRYYRLMDYGSKKPLETYFVCKSWSDGWCSFFTHDTWSFFWGVWSLIHATWVGTLTLQHLWYAAHGKTTYEWLRNSGMTVLWDQGGMLNNLIDFCKSSGREWLERDRLLGSEQA